MQTTRGKLLHKHQYVYFLAFVTGILKAPYKQLELIQIYELSHASKQAQIA